MDIRSSRVYSELIRTLSFLFKPIFSANHRWAMAREEESLKLELTRRRATTPENAARIPPPPGPTFPHSMRNKRIIIKGV